MTLYGDKKLANYRNLEGTQKDKFQIDAVNGGSLLKNNAGTLQIKTGDDASLDELQGAAPTASDSFVTRQYYEDNLPPQRYMFRADGILRTITDLDATVTIAGTISSIRAFRQDAGTGSSTIIDIHKNGTTIFTTQGNRPEFLQSAGDDVTVTATPDVTSLVDGDILTLDIDQVETGNAQNIWVEVVL